MDTFVAGVEVFVGVLLCCWLFCCVFGFGVFFCVLWGFCLVFYVCFCGFFLSCLFVLEIFCLVAIVFEGGRQYQRVTVETLQGCRAATGVCAPVICRYSSSCLA